MVIFGGIIAVKVMGLGHDREGESYSLQIADWSSLKYLPFFDITPLINYLVSCYIGLCIVLYINWSITIKCLQPLRHPPPQPFCLIEVIFKCVNNINKCLIKVTFSLPRFALNCNSKKRSRPTFPFSFYVALTKLNLAPMHHARDPSLSIWYKPFTSTYTTNAGK